MSWFLCMVVIGLIIKDSLNYYYRHVDRSCGCIDSTELVRALRMAKKKSQQRAERTTES